jgi:hypothetical protein
MKQIFHRWETWECYKAGFYDDNKNGLSKEFCQNEYAKFLSDLPVFNSAMHRVAKEWPNSCENFLTNENINRIAWLGQAAMCIHTGISSLHRGGFYLLTKEQQEAANLEAESFLTSWLIEHEKS